MTNEPQTKPENPCAAQYREFLEQTKDHVLTVIKDNELDRRMYVGSPKHIYWSWSVITWPGYLTTVGDIANGYIFSRETDMIAFLGTSRTNYYSDGAPSIDFRYWAEKLQGHESVRVYSDTRFLQRLEEHLSEHEEMGDEAQAAYEANIASLKTACQRAAVDHNAFLIELQGQPGPSFDENRDRLQEILDEDAACELYLFEKNAIPEESPVERRAEIIESAKCSDYSQEQAYEWLANNEDRIGAYDTWEWKFTEYDVHFLFTCWAIELTIRLWRAYVANKDTSELNPATIAQPATKNSKFAE